MDSELIISERTPLPFDWFFVAVFSYFVILALIRLLAPTMVFPIWQKKKQRNLFFKDANLPNYLLLLLILCSWTGFSLALAEVLSFFGFVLPFQPLLFAFAMVFLYFFLKHLLRKISSGLLRIHEVISKQISLTINSDFVWTLITFPLIVLNHYIENDYLIWIICFIFCVNFLQKFILSWMLFFRKLKTLEILLYFCTIDILPLLLLARYTLNYFYEQSAL